MFINKNKDGTNNLCGKTVCAKRKQLRLSQRELAAKLQLVGLDVDKNAVQRIESGQRIVTDIELSALATVFECSVGDLIEITVFG